MRRLLCGAVLLSLLCSCAAPAAETPQVVSVMTPEESAAQCAQLLLDSQSDGESYRLLAPEDVEFYLSEVYGIPEDSRGSAALIYTARGVDARELALIWGTDSVASNAAAGALEAYRQNRLGDFTGYAPDQADLVERALVMEGNMALLMICADPDAAQKVLEEQLSYLVIKPYDPNAEAPEPYDWTDYVEEHGWRLFDPPGEFDMTPCDTTAIREAWETGDDSGLSEKDAAVLAWCRETWEVQCIAEKTDIQKEITLHDLIIREGSYDQTVHDPRTPFGREDNTNPYGLLIQGYGICLGYATTFQLLMDLAGIECITVIGASSGSSEDHAWNMVKLEGEWYCVDPTWDDPAMTNPSAYSRVELARLQHRYFNVTSDYMRETDHQWDYQNVPEATTTRFRWEGVGQIPT